jgi:hypothetical protein
MLCVDVAFERILNPAVYAPLSTERITSGPLSEVYWATPASGISVPEVAAAELEERWEVHVRGHPSSPEEEGDGRHQGRNPPWQRDELILALDLYMAHGGKHLSEDHPEVIELSELLNALPIHTNRPDRQTFRNPAGVSMKLRNFCRFDPGQAGTGLTRGNKLEEEVWQKYSENAELLRQVAGAIRHGYKLPESSVIPGESDEEEEFPEGRVLYRMHRARERNRSVVEKAKQQAALSERTSSSATIRGPCPNWPRTRRRS